MNSIAEKKRISEINIIGWILENIPTSTIKHTTLSDWEKLSNINNKKTGKMLSQSSSDVQDIVCGWGFNLMTGFLLSEQTIPSQIRITKENPHRAYMAETSKKKS